MRGPWDPRVSDAEFAELQRAAQANAGNLNTAPANIGKAQPMNTQATAGGLLLLQDTQLISMRVNTPQQWIVSLRQPTRPNAPQPWNSDFDGGTYHPPPGPPVSQFGAPSVGASSLGQFTAQLRAKLRWGAGGVTYYTQFDWPMMGGVFGVVADTFDLDVVNGANGAGVIQGVPADYVPTIGAFMVQGVAADPLPLRWLDKPSNPPAGIASGLSADWSIKPFSRRVRILSGGSKCGVTFCCLNGAGILYVVASSTVAEAVAGGGVDALVDVPSGASIMRVFNGSAAAAVITPEWWMGLS